jgi:hypothetical protein
MGQGTGRGICNRRLQRGSPAYNQADGKMPLPLTQTQTVIDKHSKGVTAASRRVPQSLQDARWLSLVQHHGAPESTFLEGRVAHGQHLQQLQWGRMGVFTVKVSTVR